MKIYKRLCYLLALVACINAHAQHSLVVKVNEPKGDIQKTMWGIFSKTSTWAPTAVFMPNW